MFPVNQIEAVQQLFSRVDAQIEAFKRVSGVRCLPCHGECCLKPDIHITVLEALPVALELLTKGIPNNCQTPSPKDPICMFFHSMAKGSFCMIYPNRPLLCRLFGFASRTDKRGQKTLLTCKKIQSAIKDYDLSSHMDLSPEIASYYLELEGINPTLALWYLPINNAFLKAMEIIGMHLDFKSREAA